MNTNLSPRERAIAQQGFAQITPHADMLGLLFYARLFELEPALRKLFRTDLADQAHSLMTMLQMCVQALDERAELTLALRQLGARHVEYGVKPQDYVTVQGALVWTIQQGMGEQWDSEMETAWTNVFRLFIDEMQSGAGTRLTGK